MGRIIQGERTSLRPVAVTDLDLLTGWFSDPEVYRWWDGYPKPREEVAAKYLGRRPAPPVVRSFIIECEGEPIGYIHHWEADVEPHDESGGIDMFLIPSQRERGLGTDAGRAMVRYLLREHGWRRVTVDPYLDNPRAIRARVARPGSRP
jgi:aminoglycoside 6'-N-acetyltransferase